MTMTNQNFIHEEMKRKLNSSNACYKSVQNLLYSRLLFGNVKIILHKSTICLWFCMGMRLGF
jgi:hypothetical protein